MARTNKVALASMALATATVLGPALAHGQAGQPHTGQPQTPRTQPGTGQPRSEELGQPQTGQPQTGQPQTGQPQMQRPGAGQQPQTGQPQTGQPQMQRPGAGQQPQTGQMQRPGQQTEQRGEEQWGEVTQDARQAMTQIQTAIGALERDDDRAARQALDQSAEKLRNIYAMGPMEVVGELDRVSMEHRKQMEGPQRGQQMDPGIQRQAGEEENGQLQPQTGQQGQQGEGMEPQAGGQRPGAQQQRQPGQMQQGQMQQGVDFAPLMTTVQRYRLYLDPEAVAGIEQAQQRHQKGDHKAAQERLVKARERLVMDMALLPVEDAYARVMAARAELEEGNRDQALRLLRNVPVLMTQVETSAPLVPVRFQLRAAAMAAEQNDWQRAHQLVDRANQQFQQLLGQADQRVAQEMRPIGRQLGELEQQLQAGRRPQPRQFREIAQRTQKIRPDAG